MTLAQLSLSFPRLKWPRKSRSSSRSGCSLRVLLDVLTITLKPHNKSHKDSNSNFSGACVPSAENRRVSTLHGSSSPLLVAPTARSSARLGDWRTCSPFTFFLTRTHTIHISALAQQCKSLHVSLFLFSLSRRHPSSAPVLFHIHSRRTSGKIAQKLEEPWQLSCRQKAPSQELYVNLYIFTNILLTFPDAAADVC
ncbi:hypothetical protein TSAR_008688 [Trichomalopsis sarcophagae]|uniref:Uncharacterized protein n=1 Tax=Trichomalopsis sarcophagae TaxID=543379 RepID=A0A232EUM2_9HYME|nr:hypothetical protein TSAR_008688 [Trichomalopsis sarcophagae]